MFVQIKNSHTISYDCLYKGTKQTKTKTLLKLTLTLNCAYLLKARLCINNGFFFLYVCNIYIIHCQRFCVSVLLFFFFSYVKLTETNFFKKKGREGSDRPIVTFWLLFKLLIFQNVKSNGLYLKLEPFPKKKKTTTAINRYKLN